MIRSKKKKILFYKDRLNFVSIYLSINLTTKRRRRCCVSIRRTHLFSVDSTSAFSSQIWADAQIFIHFALSIFTLPNHVYEKAIWQCSFLKNIAHGWTKKHIIIYKKPTTVLLIFDKGPRGREERVRINLVYSFYKQENKD